MDELMKAISKDWQEQNPNCSGKLAVERFVAKAENRYMIVAGEIWTGAKLR